MTMDEISKSIASQIEFANIRLCDAEREERDSAEAWKGYLHALRWVQEEIKRGNQ